ncbi:MAG: NUDIX domain-containing protein [Epsilonproteobacteria bacterium]|nr:NUDIX domain-containing protein [Campylobacterota bacterium]
MTHHNQNIAVGVAVFIVKDGKVLLGKRLNSHGHETWSPPGGHLENRETIEDCARREVKEETGLEIKNIRLGTYTNNIFPDENRHSITLYVTADYISGTEKIMEPDKCEEWRWVAWKPDDFPQPLFFPIQELLKQNYSPIR